MNKESDNRKLAAIATILFHGLVLVWMLFFGLKFIPSLGEEGILVNFGNSETGFGDNEIANETSSPVNPPVERNNVRDEESILTQDIEEAPAVVEKRTPERKVENTVPKEDVQPEPVKERSPDPRALFPGNSSGNASAGSQGISEGSGNQGQPTGDLSSQNYEGSGQGGNGNGISFDLSGRSSQSLPLPEYTSQSEGRVVVEIIVDRDGRVTSATPGIKGSTTTDERLLRAAQRAALQSRFSRKVDAPVQKGTITYIFRLQN